jgi:O-antigen ligase
VKQLKISVQIVDGPFHPVLARLPVLLALFLGIFGTYLSLSLTSMSSKYTIIVCMGLIGIAALVYFHRYLTQLSLFAFVIATGIGAQYRFLTQNDQFYEGFNHHSGALAEPMIFLVDLPLFLILGIALYRIILLRWPLPKWTGLDTCIVLFLAACAISCFNAPNQPLAFFEILRYIKYTMLYLALRMLFNEKNHTRLIVVACLFLIFLEGIVAIAQYFFGFVVPFSVNGGIGGVSSDTVSGGLNFARVGGILGASNTFGTWLLLPMCLMGAALFLQIKKRYKAVIFSIFTLGLTALVLTFSRAGWLSFFCCCIFILSTMVLRNRLKPVQMRFIVMFAVISVVVAQVSGMGHYIITRITTDDIGAIGIRPEMNSIAMEMVKEFPFMGVGINNFQEVVHHYDRTHLTTQFDSVPHNIFMYFASETGIFGVLFFLSLGVLLFKKSISIVKNPPDEYGFLIGVTCAAGFLGFLVNGQFDHNLRNELLIAQCTLMAALIMSVKPIKPHPEKTVEI